MKRLRYNRRNIFMTSLLIICMLVLSINVNRLTATPEVPYGPFPDKAILFSQGPETPVVPMIERDEMTAWLYYLRTPENIDRARASADIKTIETYGGAVQLLINPLETTEGFNPFSIREVREAFNWLIDREYIVSEIYRGRAVPRYTMFRTIFPDYARIVDYIKILESKYSFNFEKAKTQIFDALSKAGAEYREGKWYYGDKPVKIVFLIRPEDERRQIGDYVSDQLEKLGITVDRQYKTSGAAFPIWGAYDPTKRGDWHIYTAGWAFTAVTAYSDTDPWFWYSPDNAPLFEEYTGPPLLRDAMDKLNNAEYKSVEERLELLRKVEELCLEDAVHVWIVDQLQIIPTSSKLGTQVIDLSGGAQSFWFLRTIRYKEGAGGEVKLGNRAMFIEGFNPIAGFSWLYDVYVYYLVADPGVFPHPHTGIYIPVRTDFTVDTRGPDGSLSVPSDALTYDLGSEKFKQVGDGVTAKSKVTFKMNWGKWHHGQPVTKADVLCAVAEVFKVASATSPLYDSVAASPGRVQFINMFKGLKFTSDDTVEVYIDYWHLDETYIASTASIWPDTPWELYVLMNKAVLDKRLAWSVDNADAWGVDQLDLTKGSSIDILSGILTGIQNSYVPPELEEFISSSDASARWSALNDFYQNKGHFWVSNGPYVFGSSDTAALQVIMDAFRDYLFKADKWDSMVTIKVPRVRVTEAPENVVPGLATKFSIAADVNGQPYDRVEVKYMMTDASGNLVATDSANPIGGGKFEITLTSSDTGRLSVGAYTLKLIAIGEEAATPYMTDYSFMVVPALSYFERLVGETRAELSTSISSLESQVDSLSGKVSSLESTVNMCLAISGGSLILALVALILAFRKK